MKPHRTDVLSLIFGVIFLGMALWWALGWTFNWTMGGTLDVTLPRLGWFLAGGLILLGIIGLMRSLRAGRRNSRASEPDDLA